MQIQSISLSVLVALAMAGIPGCATQSSFGSGQLSSADIDRIVKGKTSKAQILSTFGQPEHMYSDPSNGNEILSYSYSQGQGVVRPISFVPGVGQLLGGSDHTATNQILKITLTKNGVVKDYEYNEYQTTGSMSSLGGLNTRTIQTR